MKSHSSHKSRCLRIFFIISSSPINETILIDPKHLGQIIKCIKQGGNQEIDFFGISIEKLKPWFFIKLRDGRSKSLDQRKVSKTYRFKPETLRILKSIKDETGQTETEILENLVAGASTN